MNGVHDLGGLQCFGKIDNKGEDVKFVDDWGETVICLNALLFWRSWL